MVRESKHYELINSQTGNAIAYFSLPGNTELKQEAEILEKKRAELAAANKLYIDLVYWQERNHVVR